MTYIYNLDFYINTNNLIINLNRRKENLNTLSKLIFISCIVQNSS